MAVAETPDPSPTSWIVWIASYPKSGNTWTRTFLHNLAKIQGGEDDAQDINDLGRFSTWEIRKPNYTAALGYEPTNEHRNEIAAARHAVQQRIADDNEGLVFIKAHQALVIDRGFSTINFTVTSGAIYVVRNPLDVAISYAHHMGRPIDEAIASMAMVNAETPITDKAVYEVYGSWSQHVESWTRKPHRAIHVMRYEDMVSDPERMFGRLVEHLRLDATPRQVAEAIARSSFQELRAQEAREGFRERSPAAERFFRDGRAGQWRELLSESQVDGIVRDHGEQMARFGYLPDA
jgi:hypothetical protein